MRLCPSEVFQKALLRAYEQPGQVRRSTLREPYARRHLLSWNCGVSLVEFVSRPEGALSAASRFRLFRQMDSWLQSPPTSASSQILPDPRKDGFRHAHWPKAFEMQLGIVRRLLVLRVWEVRLDRGPSYARAQPARYGRAYTVYACEAYVHQVLEGLIRTRECSLEGSWETSSSQEAHLHPLKRQMSVAWNECQLDDTHA